MGDQPRSRSLTATMIARLERQGGCNRDRDQHVALAVRWSLVGTEGTAGGAFDMNIATVDLIAATSTVIAAF